MHPGTAQVPSPLAYERDGPAGYIRAQFQCDSKPFGCWPVEVPDPRPGRSSRKDGYRTVVHEFDLINHPSIARCYVVRHRLEGGCVGSVWVFEKEPRVMNCPERAVIEMLARIADSEQPAQISRS